MARKKVISIDADRTIKFEKPGQKLSGYYIGFKTVESNFGPSKLHVFQGEKDTVGCWGSADIDDKLLKVSPGHMTWVNYTGKINLPNKQTKKKFEVEWDDELSIEVPDIAVDTSPREEVEESEEAPAEEEQEAAGNDEPADVDEESMEEQAEEEEETAAPPKPLVKRPLAKTQPPAAATLKKTATAATDLLNRAKR